MAKLAKRYTGGAAQAYDGARRYQAKWAFEQEAVGELLAGLKGVETVLDIPIGTGRFLALYDELGWAVTGMDVSEDMLAEAAEKAASQGEPVNLLYSDIRRINAKDRQFDVSICIRLLNHLGPKVFREAMAELGRVSRGYIIVGIRTRASAVELLRDRQLVQWPAQAALRLYPLVSRLALTMYSPVFVQSVFDSLNLRVANQFPIMPRRNGIDYKLYVLAPSFRQ